MEHWRFTITFTLTLLIFLSAKAAAQIASESVMPVTLMHLTTYEGRGFFYEMKTAYKWELSRKYCNDAGLKLAEIDSKDLLTHINEQAKMDTSFPKDKYFWLGGHEEMNPHVFIWNSTGARMNSEIQWDEFGGPHTCVSYCCNSMEARLHADPCDKGERYPMCESKKQKILSLE